MKFIIYRDGAGQWRWTYQVNGRKIADGGEGHPTQGKCLEEIAHMREAVIAPIQISSFTGRTEYENGGGSQGIGLGIETNRRIR